jgi:hypothetical protein
MIRDDVERQRTRLELKLQKAMVEFEKRTGLRLTSIRVSTGSRRVLTTAELPEGDGIPVLTDAVKP